MRKSHQLRLRDLRDIYRLIGECRDLGRDYGAWRAHLLTRLCALLDAQVGVGVQAVSNDGGEPAPIGTVSVGWRSTDAERCFQQFVDEELPCSDPVFDGIHALLHEGKVLVVRCRRELVDDRVWYRSEFYNNYPRRGGLNECLYSYCWLPAEPSTIIDGIELHRPQRRRPFGERERRMLRWLHRELRPLIGRQLAAPGDPSPTELSPRLCQTLELLLEGAAEKQIARRLKLSHSTVHGYVTALYRHFGVHSRGELLARWNRFDRAAK
jgi:DNA-binding CsgD family transcriptional regulator